MTHDAERIRILLVHGNTEWYGSDRSLVLLATNLQRQGWNVGVVLPGRGAAFEALHRQGIEPVIIDPAPLRPRVFNARRWVNYLIRDLPLAVWRVRRVARGASLVHLNTSNLLGGVLGAGLARRPVVLHVRETYAGHEREWRWYCRLIKPFVTHVIATSTDIAREVAAAGLGDRVTVVHNGMEFGSTAPADGNGPVVAVGRLNDWKGHDVLIQAIARLRDRGVVVSCEIAGNAFPGQEHREKELQDLAVARGVADQVRLLGYVDDIDALLTRAGIFAMPSTRPEPFGLALVDAMARGLASIASDAGGPKEIIRHEVTGLLVPPGDAGALADAIERLSGDPTLRQRLGRAAAEDVRTRFSIDMTARRVGEVYEHLLRRATA